MLLQKLYAKILEKDMHLPTTKEGAFFKNYFNEFGIMQHKIQSFSYTY
jgi:hypothetical protein